ncbi:MAG: electron transfer flavoprotein subunit beta/FixA family protein [Bacteroidales bacterium]|nr:electron transfer flavoprotein subunit beta/FixA family protein [Bacteroidales bacterium]MCF8345291.1 electron transfer flavoprotein subunit beta/FixA family protein [Bacteroidales bacterium]MCF8352324.1 electron transfer flavoprotein subunit beta/FixA family protein [Bacteroidales bacterium]MCF8377396.1 electron transfer flavoprotein subunit beta/FixA family protein [Bacteroidales bacterium]MCF8401325.1 electron transfer flavoprotein subunit beta/FixA family protein [Bacteroidales bacterium
MKILLCISNVPDTTTKIRFKDDNKEFDASGVQWIINPWDELALTRALELKEGSGGKIEKISVALVGDKSTEPTIRKALAIGADDAFRIDSEPKDSYYVANQLKELAKDFDIVMCGIESADYTSSAVGGMLSEMLEWPSVSSVSSLEIEGDEVKIRREIDGGQEVVSAELPFVAIVQKGIALEPRIPAMRGIMMARKKPLNVVEPIQADVLTAYESFELPPPKADVKLVDEENVKELVELLKNEAKAI